MTFTYNNLTFCIAPGGAFTVTDAYGHVIYRGRARNGNVLAAVADYNLARRTGIDASYGLPLNHGRGLK